MNNVVSYVLLGVVILAFGWFFIGLYQKSMGYDKEIVSYCTEVCENNSMTFKTYIDSHSDTCVCSDGNIGIGRVLEDQTPYHGW